jgi:hypothetical protein
MSDIVRRLRASVIHDAVSGSPFERHICEMQMSAAADEIEQLQEALDKANGQVGDLIDNAAASDPRDRVWVLVTFVELAEKDRRIEELVAALLEIIESKGAFDRDPLKHASNVIEETIDIARRALEGK